MTTSDGRPGGGYERTDVPFKGALILTLGVLAATVAAILLMYPLFRHLAKRETDLQPARTTLIATSPDALPPDPRLQANPVDELRAFRASQHLALDGYAWTDRGAGRVRIPIERAIDFVVERGGGAP